MDIPEVGPAITRELSKRLKTLSDQTWHAYRPGLDRWLEIAGLAHTRSDMMGVFTSVTEAGMRHPLSRG